MADAASRERWAHTSALLALVANCHRDGKKSRAFKPSDFNPHLQRRRKPEPTERVGVSVLRDLFVKGD